MRYMQACMHARTYTQTLSLSHSLSYAYQDVVHFVCMEDEIKFANIFEDLMHAHVRARARAHTHTNTHTNTQTRTRTCTHTHICARTHTSSAAPTRIDSLAEFSSPQQVAQVPVTYVV